MSSSSLEDRARVGAVRVTTMPFWSGEVISASVHDLEEVVRLPQTGHSTLWVLVSEDRARAALVATDDLELDVWCRTDILAWSRMFGITHRDDMLSRSRCRFLAGLLADDLIRTGIHVDRPGEVDLSEGIRSDMTHFHRSAIGALALAGLDLRPAA